VRKCERKLRFFTSSLEEAHKASQANVKRQFAMVATEFRGHANTMAEEMTAYMRVLSPRQVDLCADVKDRDKLEINALDTWDAKSISAQEAAQAWNAQRVSILLYAQTTESSQFREGQDERSEGHRLWWDRT
jgi:hypothetical protein